MNRNAFIEKRRELANDFIQHNPDNHALVVPVHPRFIDGNNKKLHDYEIGSKEFLQEVMAYDLMKPGTLEMYEVCECQYSVFPLVNEEKGARDIYEILNHTGVKLYTFVLDKILKNEFVDEFTEFCVTTSNSGMWHADESSGYFDPAEHIRGCLNTFQNQRIQGISKAKNKVLTTSVCIFIANKEQVKWCFTKSGSLYKLGTEMPSGYMDSKTIELNFQ